MSTINLDRERIRDLFDLRRRATSSGGRFSDYSEDPYPEFRRLRETGPVHEGVPHELIGMEGNASFMGIPDPGRPHYSVFSYGECDTIYRDEETFRSWPPDTPRVGT